MGVYSTGLAAGGGLGQGSGGGSWYGIRLGGILWSRSSIQGEGQGHLKFLDEPVLPNEGQTYTADIYNTEEARSYQISVATATFSAIAFLALICGMLFWMAKLCRKIDTKKRPNFDTVKTPGLIIPIRKDRYLIEEDIEAGGPNSGCYDNAEHNKDNRKEEEKEGAEKSTNYKTNIVLSSPYVDNWHNI
ncbi:uncharacterized protein LOC110860285 [Folsomia candida]|uniref:Uncharacterized protein n=1 Tax=Folsomia candida TaxID=158441 RepID=A0A226D869_FOLCA|nr:uncharacterized protein LOC110860285 [Folsomia candida]OXA41054.1 hypothetical protein Fcan01_24188 [Folsomia candida]